MDRVEGVGVVLDPAMTTVWREAIGRFGKQ